VKYAFIDTQRGSHAVRTLCRTLRVSASGYYAARSRSPSARAQRQSSLAARIREVHMASRQTYGAPRVHAERCAQGIACCRNTVAKLMRREQIVPRAIRHFRVTTDSRNTKEVSPNLVMRRFKAKRPNSCWLSDVTYIPTREGWLYLAAVLDVYFRAIVGWAMSHTLGGQLATDALAMAISRRGVPELVHSDRGSTYATSIYLDLIRKHGIRQSMSRKGNCWDTQSRMALNDRPSLTRAGILSLGWR
jgi:putative transposase